MFARLLPLAHTQPRESLLALSLPLLLSEEDFACTMMLPSTGARGPLFMLACTAGVLLILVFGFMTWSAPERIPFPHNGGSTHVEMYVALLTKLQLAGFAGFSVI